MSVSRCYIRRYKDATAPIWRAEELRELIAHYNKVRSDKSDQIWVVKQAMRDLEQEAGRSSIFGCRGRDCEEVCSGLCYIRYCTNAHLVAAFRALSKAHDCLWQQSNVLDKKLQIATRLLETLTRDYALAVVA